MTTCVCSLCSVALSFLQLQLEEPVRAGTLCSQAAAVRGAIGTQDGTDDLNGGREVNIFYNASLLPLLSYPCPACDQPASCQLALCT